MFEAALVENGRFIRRGVFVFFSTVTHWRKIPEPPKDALRGAEKIPAEDVAKVVRCKDCRYNDGGRKCLYPDSIIAAPDDDDFCSYGKERGEEEDRGDRGALIERVARVLLDRQMFWCGKECRHNNGQITCMDCTEAWLRERLKNDQ